MSMITRILFYDAMYIAGFALMLLTSLLGCRIYGIGRVRAAVYSVISFAAGIGGALLIGVIYNKLQSLKGTETDIRVDMLGAMIFTLFFLIAAVPIEKLFVKARAKKADSAEVRNVSFRDTIDMIIPGAFIVFTCIKFGCHVKGCCYGVIWDRGIKSPLADVRLFPVQLCEFASLCAILILCCFLKRTKIYRRGMAAPLTAFFYGVARFLWEFLRFYTPEMKHFALGLSLWQLFCLLVIVVTAVWLAVLYKTQPGEPLPKGKLILKAEELSADRKKQNGRKNAKGKNANAKNKNKKKKATTAKRK
ncbi:MAG: prolipoprotein diacylglyceryl transferase [Clostridia bacterium]|nr:prolipoprotein diacylglyceryl transferase [Clostridia bacterium]